MYIVNLIPYKRFKGMCSYKKKWGSEFILKIHKETTQTVIHPEKKTTHKHTHIYTHEIINYIELYVNLSIPI